MRMSKSSFLTYVDCPYNLFLDKVKGRRDLRPTPKEGSPLKKGTDLHKIFEDFYTVCEEEDINTKQDILDILLQHPLSSKAHLEKEDPTHENLYLNKYRNYHALEGEIHRHLDNFADFNMATIERRGLDNFIPEYREMEIYNEEKDFLGYIDRAEKLNDGTYRILDYKTGKVKTLRNYLAELSLYKWLFETETGKTVTRVGIYFSDNGWLRTMELEQSDIFESLYLLDTVSEMVRERIFPRFRNEYMCKKFCENWGICHLPLYEDEIVSEVPAKYANILW